MRKIIKIKASTSQSTGQAADNLVIIRGPVRFGMTSSTHAERLPVKPAMTGTYHS